MNNEWLNDESWSILKNVFDLWKSVFIILFIIIQNQKNRILRKS